jgi:hypothetical protein
MLPVVMVGESAGISKTVCGGSVDMHRAFLGMEDSSKLGGPNGLAGHPHLKTLTLGITRALSLVWARTVPGAEARVPMALACRASRNRPTALVMREATGGIKQEASGGMPAVCD